MSELSGCERDSSVVLGPFYCFIVDSWQSTILFSILGFFSCVIVKGFIRCVFGFHLPLYTDIISIINKNLNELSKIGKICFSLLL